MFVNSVTHLSKILVCSNFCTHNQPFMVKTLSCFTNMDKQAVRHFTKANNVSKQQARTGRTAVLFSFSYPLPHFYILCGSGSCTSPSCPLLSAWALSKPAPSAGLLRQWKKEEEMAWTRELLPGFVHQRKGKTVPSEIGIAFRGFYRSLAEHERDFAQ